MAIEYRVLGPVEVLSDGRPVHVSPRPRAVLATLLLHADRVVAAPRLIDAIWGERPPETATNVLQGYVSSLRKLVGHDALETQDPGYVLRVEHDALDLHRFERLATDGARALEEGRPGEAADALCSALELWRGEALADLADGDVLRRAAARLDELRLASLERRLEADLACGRHRELVGELETLTAEHPLREQPRALLMLSLYRAGRQADALDVYRRTRTLLVDELGLEPSAELQELERAMLRQDVSLDLLSSPHVVPRDERHTVLVAALELASAGRLVALAEPLALDRAREIVLAATVAEAGLLGIASAQLRELQARVAARGIAIRAAAFTSLTPGLDLARMATEQDAELLLVDTPHGLLEDPRLLGVLEDAPCDVAVLVEGEERAGPVLVPFTGAEHDWTAVELGAWLARSTGERLILAGSTVGDGGRDASRLLASASLAIQRTLGVAAEPLLVEPTPQSLVDAAKDAGLAVVGLTDRWRRAGVGRTRTALALSPHHPTLLVRRGLRPGGLAPRAAETRFTWTLVS